jgi:hypothetical protein
VTSPPHGRLSGRVQNGATDVTVLQRTGFEEIRQYYTIISQTEIHNVFCVLFDFLLFSGGVAYCCSVAVLHIVVQ